MSPLFEHHTTSLMFNDTPLHLTNLIGNALVALIEKTLVKAVYYQNMSCLRSILLGWCCESA